jgi:hypothetical protein
VVEGPRRCALRRVELRKKDGIGVLDPAGLEEVQEDAPFVDVDGAGALDGREDFVFDEPGVGGVGAVEGGEDGGFDARLAGQGDAFEVEGVQGVVVELLAGVEGDYEGGGEVMLKAQVNVW